MSEWSAPEFESKICPPEKLAERLAALPRPLVFTNGCFDILHRGHVTYLAQARSAGAALVLALNTDASVRRQAKGTTARLILWKPRGSVSGIGQRGFGHMV